MHFTLRILTDLSRLPEIELLRVAAWEASPRRGVVNAQLFPNGWGDSYDATGCHFIATNDSGDIVGAARLHILDHVTALPHFSSIAAFGFPAETPIAYFSRVVVDPRYRGRRLSRELDEARLHLARERSARWAIAFATEERTPGLCRTFGFVVKGPVFLNYHETTMPHRVMVLVRHHPIELYTQEHSR